MLKMFIKYPYFNEQELNRRGYNYFIELYPKSEVYDTQNILNLIELDAIAQDGDIKQYAYILHDSAVLYPYLYHEVYMPNVL